jgi:hypothetical protein
METTGSFTEIKLSAAFSAEGGLEIFQAHGLGQRPIVLDALELDPTSLQKVLAEIDIVFAALKFHTPFPYPVYLLSRLATPHPPLIVINSAKELPTFYLTQSFIPTGKDMGLLTRIKILQQRLLNTDPQLWDAIQEQNEQDQLILEMELASFYQQLQETMAK